MGRFNRFFDTVKKVADPQIQPGDETAIAENPRNWLTGHANSVLPEGLQIPAQTVAEDKQFAQNLPETMGAATMGSVGGSSRFGRVLGTDGAAAKSVSGAEVMAHPEMLEFLKNAENFKKLNPYPSQYGNAKQALADKLRGK